MALYKARVNFRGAGSVTGSSAIQRKVPITSPSKYTDSDRLGQVVLIWNIETGQKVVPGESFVVRGEIDEAVYSAQGLFRGANYTYILKYNLNGASSPSSISNQSKSLESNSPAIQTVSIQIGSTTPSKTDTTFAGWALANNTTQNLKNSGDTLSKKFTPNGADQSAVQNLYAVWKIYQRFNANGGSFPTGSTTWSEKIGYYQTTGYTFTIPAGGPTKTGYEFLGWSQSSTATTPYIAKSSSAQTIFLTKNTTWYAVWREQYKIEYKRGDGTGGTEVTEYKSKDVSYTLRGQTFTKTGYNQTGWSKTSGGSKAYDLKDTYTTNASLTLYPYWTPIKYNVLYKNNNAIKDFVEKITNFPTDTTVPCGQSYTISTKIPSCPYFWFNTDNPSNYNIWKDQNNIGRKPGFSFTMPAHNVTLTAQWVRKKANILYDKGDGQPVSGSINVNQGELIYLWDKDVATSNQFTKPGYVLAYWKYKNQGYELGGSFIVDDIANGGNIILTAVWIPIAQYRYPDYGASVYGARVIYDPDYIIEGGN